MPKQNDSETNYFEDAESEGRPENHRTMVATIIVVLALAGIGAIFAFGPKIGKKDAPAKVVETGEVAADPNKPAANAPEPAIAETASGTATPANNAPDSLIRSLTPPGGWVAQENRDGTRTVAVFFKSKPEIDSAGNEIFTENINISRSRLSNAKAKNLADYVNSVEDRVEKQMTNVVPTKNFEVLLDDGTPAIVTAFAYTLNNTSLRSLMLFTGKGDDIYTVIGIVLDSNWDEEKDALWNSMMSFKIPASK
ncbi:MAG: hypothetical protein MUD10_00700 [Candidatus Pacebacteria bacterium]|jgi:hypothetical protein|nr:hypothetical protein [Candidatus Paceibacterota bacterium]